MAEKILYLPGTRAILSYKDEEGTSYQSIVTVIEKRVLAGQNLYAIKAPIHALKNVQHVRMLKNGVETEAGWTVGLVKASLLGPLGTQTFRIVQQGETI